MQKKLWGSLGSFEKFSMQKNVGQFGQLGSLGSLDSLECWGSWGSFYLGFKKMGIQKKLLGSLGSFFTLKNAVCKKNYGVVGVVFFGIQ